eukprot:2973922-Pyramimonas_sp.AAC.2
MCRAAIARHRACATVSFWPDDRPRAQHADIFTALCRRRVFSRFVASRVAVCCLRPVRSARVPLRRAAARSARRPAGDAGRRDSASGNARLLRCHGGADCAAAVRARRRGAPPRNRRA